MIEEKPDLRPVVVGVDVNTNYLALAVFEGRGKSLHYLDYRIIPLQVDKKASPWERAMHVATNLRNYLALHKVIRAHIEEIPFVNSPKTMRDLQTVAAIARFILSSHGAATFVLNNTTWKRLTVGKGNAKKQDVKEWCLAQGEIESALPQDVYDAYAITLAGEAQFVV